MFGKVESDNSIGIQDAQSVSKRFQHAVGMDLVAKSDLSTGE